LGFSPPKNNVWPQWAQKSTNLPSKCSFTNWGGTEGKKMENRTWGVKGFCAFQKIGVKRKNLWWKKKHPRGKQGQSGEDVGSMEKTGLGPPAKPKSKKWPWNKFTFRRVGWAPPQVWSRIKTDQKGGTFPQSNHVLVGLWQCGVFFFVVVFWFFVSQHQKARGSDGCPWCFVKDEKGIWVGVSLGTPSKTPN